MMLIMMIMMIRMKMVFVVVVMIQYNYDSIILSGLSQLEYNEQGAYLDGSTLRSSSRR